jgi:hypothetical protein
MVKTILCNAVGVVLKKMHFLQEALTRTGSSYFTARVLEEARTRKPNPRHMYFFSRYISSFGLLYWQNQFGREYAPMQIANKCPRG